MSLSFRIISRFVGSEPAWFKRLEGHARGDGAVADDGHDATIIAERSAPTAMPSAALMEVLEWPTPKVSYSLSERVGNGASPPGLLDGVELVAPARQDLVRIRLMAHVPHDAITGRVKDVVQSDGQLHGSQASGEVTPTGAHALDQEFPQLLGEGR